MLRRFFKKMNSEAPPATDNDVVSEASRAISEDTTGNQNDVSLAGSTHSSLAGSSHQRAMDKVASETGWALNKPLNVKSAIVDKVSPGQSRVKKLSAFDACVEACDELAAASIFSGRVDPATNLVDCSVLVSSDGELLIVPQAQQRRKKDPEITVNDKDLAHDSKHSRMQEMLHETAIELGDEYRSAVFLGNDLDPSGDKALNGFATKGWSVAATSLALRQSADTLLDLSEFCEDLVLNKKSSAASENQMVNRLRPMVEGPEHGGLRVVEYNQYLKETFPRSQIEILSTRVGPLSSPDSSIQATVGALENYYLSAAESESKRWKSLADASGPLARLRKTQNQTETRAERREIALLTMSQNTRAMEDQLVRCKQDAIRKWDGVHAAEERITKRIQGNTAERSRLREQSRLEQLKNDEAARAKDASHGNLGATSSEIWDIVSAVAESMEEGSFEPMDLPQAPLAAPRDKSHGKVSCGISSVVDSFDDDSHLTVPLTSRHELEDELGLPELRVAAMEGDEAIAHAASDLLHGLSMLDTTHRSARLAAETCLVEASNAQTECLHAIVKAERDSLQMRLKLLDELEVTAQNIEARSDIDQYITMDKKEVGGSSTMGEDDDGGIASALAVLHNHVDGGMGMGSSTTTSSKTKEYDNGSEGEHGLTVEYIEEAIGKVFARNTLLLTGALEDTSEDTKVDEAREELEMAVSRLVRLGEDKSATARPLRSTTCYTINAKRNIHRKVPSRLQFQGLCRVFSGLLSGCGTDSSGASLAKMLMLLSQSFFMVDDSGGKVTVQSKLVGHDFWQDEEFWDQALRQTVAESLTNSGVMSNFERYSSQVVTAAAKKKSEWTEAYKMKWHDLNDKERCEAASQVHAVVSAQIGALAQSRIELGCGLERSAAFVRRMAVRNQLPLSQRAMLLQHLTRSDEGN